MPTPGSPSGSGAISRPPLLKMLAILETGVAEIDADHRDLIDRFNDLTAIAAREVPWRALHAAAHLLAQRCREHFEREEMILARAMARQKEMAIRTAMGASRWQIVRQLLTESMLLAVVGGGLGVLLAVWAIDLLVAFAPANIPRVREVSVDCL